MNFFTKLTGRLLSVFAITGMALVPLQPANAGSEQSIQAAPAVDNSKADTSANGITDRGLSPRRDMGTTAPPGTISPPTTGSTNFKCSPHTGRCNCSGATDCNYMKDLIKESCGKITCTGSGSSQTCKCTLAGH